MRKYAVNVPSPLKSLTTTETNVVYDEKGESIQDELESKHGLQCGSGDEIGAVAEFVIPGVHHPGINAEAGGARKWTVIARAEQPKDTFRTKDDTTVFTGISSVFRAGRSRTSMWEGHGSHASSGW